MAKLTPEEKRIIIGKLEKKFDSQNIVSLGYKRYAIIERQPQVPLGSIFAPYKKYKMSDEDGNLINLENEYNGIFSFAKGVATVCIKKNPQLIKTDIGDKVIDESKEGLIDVDGSELLPCIFDSISVKLDGFVEINKDGLRQTTNVNKIINGEFDWDNP